MNLLFFLFYHLWDNDVTSRRATKKLDNHRVGDSFVRDSYSRRVPCGVHPLSRTSCNIAVQELYIESTMPLSVCVHYGILITD